MKEFPQIIKCISGLLIFIMLIPLSGCYSAKIISTSELPPPNVSRYAFFIHYEKSRFLLKDWIISNDTLSGKIDSGRPYVKNNTIHIYPSSDSLLEINNKNILRIPLDGILKIVKKEFSVSGTIVLAALGIPAFISIVSVINFAIYGF